MISDKFGSQFNRKSKTYFFTFLNSLMSVFPDSNWKKFESHSFHLQNPCILQTKTDQKKGPRKMNFDNFEIQEFISENSKSR